METPDIRLALSRHVPMAVVDLRRGVVVVCSLHRKRSERLCFHLKDRKSLACRAREHWTLGLKMSNAKIPPGARCRLTIAKAARISSIEWRCSSELRAMKISPNWRPRSKLRISPSTSSTETFAAAARSFAAFSIGADSVDAGDPQSRTGNRHCQLACSAGEFQNVAGALRESST